MIIVVPGHGPVFHDHAPLRAMLDYLQSVLDVARRGREAGFSPLLAAHDLDHDLDHDLGGDTPK